MRHDVEFNSQGTRCAAWFYMPEGEGPFPTIVMGHGLGCIKEMCLDDYASRFRDAGYACLVFDYRHFGSSDGEPRQLLSIPRQLKDWKAAIDYARGLPQVDAKNIVLWGWSLSGGHVLSVADDDPNIAAVISQMPHVSGYASLTAEKLTTVARVTMHGLYDAVRGLFGGNPHYVLSTASGGETGMLNGPGQSEKYLALVPEKTEFDRRVAARFALNIGLYSPGRALPRLSMPTLVQVALGDLTTPAKPVIEECDRAPNAALIQYETGHFGLYSEPLFATVIQDQLDFLKNHVGAQVDDRKEPRLSRLSSPAAKSSL